MAADENKNSVFFGTGNRWKIWLDVNLKRDVLNKMSLNIT